MAYHIGRILSRYFGYELFDIETIAPGQPLFTYDTPITTVSMDEAQRMMTADDLIIMSPFYSEYLLGMRLPGRKIMYVQGFRKLLVMDCQCDLYISVSSMVSHHIHTLYGISSQVIPAFIQLGHMPDAPAWHERPVGSILVHAKDNSEDLQTLYQHILGELKSKAPDIDITQILDGRGLSREKFLERIGSVRYLLNLSLAEGFGLIPLEAMAMGTTVIGLDGLAGKDYMRPGHNCMVESMTTLPALTDSIMTAIQNEQLAFECAENGRLTASHYGHTPFKNAWIRELSLFLGRNPNHA